MSRETLSPGPRRRLEHCLWPARMRPQVEQYNILDFADWEDQDAFGRQFEKLVDGLGLFYPQGGGEG